MSFKPIYNSTVKIVPLDREKFHQFWSIPSQTTIEADKLIGNVLACPDDATLLELMKMFHRSHIESILNKLFKNDKQVIKYLSKKIEKLYNLTIC